MRTCIASSTGSTIASTVSWQAAATAFIALTGANLRSPIGRPLVSASNPRKVYVCAKLQPVN